MGQSSVTETPMMDSAGFALGTCFTTGTGHMIAQALVGFLSPFLPDVPGSAPNHILNLHTHICIYTYIYRLYMHAMVFTYRYTLYNSLLDHLMKQSRYFCPWGGDHRPRPPTLSGLQQQSADPTHPADDATHTDLPRATWRTTRGNKGNAGRPPVKMGGWWDTYIVDM